MPVTGRIAAASTAVAGALVLFLAACSSPAPVSLADGAAAGGTTAAAPGESSPAAEPGTELADPTAPPATTAAPTQRATATKKASAKKASASAIASRAATSPKTATSKSASVAAAPKTSVSPSPKPAITRKPPVSPSPSEDGGSGGGSGGSSATAEETSVVELTNAERAKNGCGPLAINATLTTVARAHSKDMAVNKFFDHNSQDGRTPFDRMKAAGYTYSMAAENIAAGQPTAASVVTAWMNSAGHRANILNCKLTQIGVGVYRLSGSPYGVYWTQDFGTPR